VTAAEAKVESGELQTGKSFKLVARKKGEMSYICRLHPVMRGVVVVK
jgi:plastocyanin